MTVPGVDVVEVSGGYIKLCVKEREETRGTL
jgi:hypothetical protein